MGLWREGDGGFLSIKYRCGWSDDKVIDLWWRKWWGHLVEEDEEEQSGWMRTMMERAHARNYIIIDSGYSIFSVVAVVIDHMVCMFLCEGNESWECKQGNYYAGLISAAQSIRAVVMCACFLSQSFVCFVLQENLIKKAVTVDAFEYERYERMKWIDVHWSKWNGKTSKTKIL